MARADEQERLAKQAVLTAQDAEAAERYFDAQNLYCVALDCRKKAERLRAVVREFTVL